MDLLAIYWNVSPVAIRIGDYGLRWYSLLFLAVFVLCFGSRFLLEYVKTVKVVVNLGFTTLTMGRVLSIPIIIVGLYLILRKRTNTCAGLT